MSKHYNPILYDYIKCLGPVDAVGQDVMANRFIKDDGTGIQFLMADGSTSVGPFDNYQHWVIRAKNSLNGTIGSSVITALDEFAIKAGSNITLGWEDDQITINASGTITALSPLTTKGDLFTFSTEDSRLPVGVDGYILSSDSTEVSGLKWIPAASGTELSLQDIHDNALGTNNYPLNLYVTSTDNNKYFDLSLSDEDSYWDVNLGAGYMDVLGETGNGLSLSVGEKFPRLYWYGLGIGNDDHWRDIILDFDSGYGINIQHTDYQSVTNNGDSTDTAIMMLDGVITIRTASGATWAGGTGIDFVLRTPPLDKLQGEDCFITWPYISGSNTVPLSVNSTYADIDGNIVVDLAPATAPVASNSPGTVGQMYSDANYFYRCVALNTWTRVAMASW